MDKLTKGKHAEEMACRFLEKQGFLLLQQNYHCYHGEIDLIMQDKEDVVFIEVRSRSNKDYGSALESINKHKIKKLIKTATHYLQKKDWLYKRNSRFDIIAIDLGSIDKKLQIDWIKNALG